MTQFCIQWVVSWRCGAHCTQPGICQTQPWPGTSTNGCTGVLSDPDRTDLLFFSQVENSHTNSMLQLPSKRQKTGGPWAHIPAGEHLLTPVSGAGWGVSSPRHPGLLLTWVPSSLWSPTHGGHVAAVYHCTCADFFLNNKREIFLRLILLSKHRPH